MQGEGDEHNLSSEYKLMINMCTGSEKKYNSSLTICVLYLK